VLNIVDQAIVPHLRNNGIGTAIMRALMDEAVERAIPVRLMVGSSNDPSLRLYLRLGFVPIATTPMYIELEWRG
jgi:ribosomal protein S18 acetylase RimI-like enzyme